MKWYIGSLDDSLRQRLEAVSRDSGMPGETVYFRPLRRGRALAVSAAVGLVLTLLGPLLAFQLAGDRNAPLLATIVVFSLSGLAGLWTAAVLVEAVRAAAARIRPFLLVTPKVLLQADYDHGLLTGFRLADAIDFKSMDTYKETTWTARIYEFSFPDGKHNVTVKTAEGIRQLDAVLDQARRGAGIAAGAGLDLLPTSPGRGQGMRCLTNPFGEGWAAVGAVLLLALMAGLVLKPLGEKLSLW